ncbi:exopolysaccharide biosynthesis protein [Granulicella sp. WH15]|uniref:tyrosine-protein phosphatase n=1 Tax=Granulicella sp. WH15 TaxID=2602070 RepID=UPI001366E68D|nr:CpsB/CapC family capsule biosynthesis tyrosine phosphatase [Granulicella sp. WH15]QHN03824.1 exopolysaccharide biosynthesis protein [Granulicella sp. WH15]
MFDVHHHLLWGLDDGSKDLATSVAMAKLAVADGITHIVCTPHSNGQYEFKPEVNAAKLAELRAALAAEKVNLTLGQGCDFHLSYDNIVNAKADPGRFSINGLGYLLVELPDYGVSRNMTEVFYELQLVGLTPIITHPERNPTLQADYSRMADWMRGGALIQVTADSVTGKMGKAAEKMAHQLLAKRWVHMLASDAHNVTSRPPRMKAAADIVAKRYGAAYAESLVLTNPKAIFEGTLMEQLEEPIGLYQEAKEQNWWQRLLN